MTKRYQRAKAVIAKRESQAIKCNTCAGSGKVVHDYSKASSWDRDYQPYSFWQPITCPTCKGTGKKL